MKITNRAKFIDFEELHKGDVFIDKTNGDVFIKIDELCDEGYGKQNAVFLENGETTYFFADDKVQHVNAELITDAFIQ